jgi:hypothetical protein
LQALATCPRPLGVTAALRRFAAQRDPTISECSRGCALCRDRRTAAPVGTDTTSASSAVAATADTMRADRSRRMRAAGTKDRLASESRMAASSLDR